MLFDVRKSTELHKSTAHIVAQKKRLSIFKLEFEAGRETEKIF